MKHMKNILAFIGISAAVYISESDSKQDNAKWCSMKDDICKCNGNVFYVTDKVK